MVKYYLNEIHCNFLIEIERMVAYAINSNYTTTENVKGYLNLQDHLNQIIKNDFYEQDQREWLNKLKELINVNPLLRARKELKIEFR